jgi:4-oxalocrotonate tautomerase
MFSGRTQEKKERLMAKVTDAVSEALEVPREAVHIVLNEVPRENIGHAGVPVSKSAP